MPLSTAADEPRAYRAQAARAPDPRSSFYSYCPVESWIPSVNLYETTANYLVCVDLAGVEKEKINLVVNNNRLVISGSRPTPRQMPAAAQPEAPPPPTRSDRVRVHLMEIDHGAFCRDVELPADIDSQRIEAHYHNGLLWIQLPKRGR